MDDDFETMDHIFKKTLIKMSIGTRKGGCDQRETVFYMHPGVKKTLDVLSKTYLIKVLCSANEKRKQNTDENMNCEVTDCANFHGVESHVSRLRDSLTRRETHFTMI